MSTPSTTSSTAIDSRRAQQLTERALALSERGDLQGAVLACRQSIALNPTAAQGYSMLGLLLERAGDSAGAITAYEKVLELDPGSLLERESLGRLRTVATQRRTTRDLFAFDDSELFEDERPDALPSLDGPLPASLSMPDTSARQNRSDGATMRDDAASLNTQSSPHTDSTFASDPDALDTSRLPTRLSGEEAVLDAPGTLAAAPSALPAISPASAATTPLSAASAAPASAIPPLLAPPPSAIHAPGHRAQPMGHSAAAQYVPPEPPSVLQKLIARPSYYFRGAPLAASTLVSLMFLLWAHNYAVSRDLPPLQNGTGTTVETIRQPPADTGATTPRTGAPINNTRPAGTTPVNPGGNTAAGRVPSNPNPAVPATSGRTAARTSAPSTPSSTPSPAAAPSNSGVPAAAPPGTTAGTPAGGASAAVPSANSGAPSSGAPARAATPPGGAGPGESGAASSGGAPVPVGGAPGRSFVRVAPPAGTGLAPTRSAARAARDERTATTPGGAGNSGAVESISRAIDAGGSDIATRFQQRAQIYLNSGENTRAINDFQSAIAAYNDMINRGDRVFLARAGIQSCQRGIQIAQSRTGH
jgi:hypothetical protein